MSRVASGPWTLTVIGSAAPTEDGRRAADAGGQAGELRKLLSNDLLELELAPRALGLGLEAHVDVAVGDAAAAANRERREVDLGERVDVLVDRTGATEGIRKAGPRWNAEVDGELAGVEIGHPGEAKPRDDEPRDGDGAQGRTDDNPAVGKRLPQPAGVAIGEALKPAVEGQGDLADGTGVLARFLPVFLGIGVVPDAGEHGVERERHEQRHHARRRRR